MVTDAALRDAAAEARDALLAAVMAEQAQLHEFSEDFEKRIRKLTRRANHPLRYQVLRYAAVVVLTLATLFGSLVAFSPEARATFVGWFRAAFEGPYAHYDSVDVTDITNVLLSYTTRFQVRLGDGENLTYKVGAMKQAVDQMEGYESGELDASFTLFPDKVVYSPLTQ